MRRTRFNRLNAALLGFLCGAMVGCPALADDTDVFFGGTSIVSGQVRPNVLFVLDTSSSMTDMDGLGITRLDRMKEALRAIISSTDNVNVGMMRFSRAGGPVLYPAAYIDEDVCNVENCASAGDIQIQVSDSADDAEEASDGSVSLTSTDLEMINDPGLAGGGESTVEVPVANGDDDVEEQVNGALVYGSSDLELVYDTAYIAGDQLIGLRFEGVDVPQGATINDARLEFRVDESGSGAVSLDILGHAHDDAPAFSSSAGEKVSDRIAGAATSAQVAWDDLPNLGVGATITSPPITSIVQEIVNRPGWNSGNTMAFMLRKDPASASGSSNKRVVESEDGSQAPKLRVTYTVPDPLADTTQTIGIRFQDVQIPQGVSITSAYLEFEVDETDSEATTLTIKREASDNAAGFSTASNDVTSRPTTPSTNDVTWTVAPWSAIDERKQSPDISAMVQDIVQRPGWCGGNSMAFIISGTGKRTAKSFDGSSGAGPLLKVTYDPESVPSTGGCLNQTVARTIATGSDDAEESTVDQSVNLGSSDLELVTESTDQLIGLRFQNLLIPQGATVLEAKLQFEVDVQRSGTLALMLRGQAHDDAPTFTSNSGDISGRATTAASVLWSNVDNPAVDQKITSPDISSIVEEVTSRPGWQSGNDLVLVIEKASGSGVREVESHNGEAAAAARLTVKIQWDAGSTPDEGTLITVRQRLLREVDNLQYKSGTPIVDTLYEAARYFRGEGVYYGKRRGNDAASTGRSEYTRVSHPSAYAGGAVYREPGCTDDNLNATACKTEEIQGSAEYVSPISETCQRSYIVLLSDGYPSYNEAADEVKSLASIASCQDSGDGECGPELTKYLYENDQSSLDGTQNITTYSIGFNFTGQWLKDVATAGGGSFYEASTAAELSGVFQSIVAEILKVDTTFVSPGATVNQYNRLSHRDDIYFTLFRPDEQPTWDGNLKRYRLAGNPAIVVDQNDVAAVDPASGFFKSTAQSFWSDDVDGNEVPKGGAAGELSLSGRDVYTYTGTTSVLADGSNALSESNASITNTMLGLDPADDPTDLLRWARGVDVLDSDEDGDATDARQQIGDPLHSKPVLITYGLTADTPPAPDTTVFFGTNEGFLHAVSTSDGTEEFAFIPQELLSNLNVHYQNLGTTAMADRYGLDGPITAWVDDANGDGEIVKADGDHVYLYVGMRRGGRNYYALDVTDRASPELLWTIKGGITGDDFEELGQTWSSPVLTKVNMDGTVYPVLMFSGGYDADQDEYAVRTVDSQGRAVFIVDARDGSLLWSGGPDSSHDATFSDMLYSIPSDLRVLDMDGDQLADQIYVGDMGGQLWRFDIRNGNVADQLVSGGVIADLAGDDAASNRRFYHAADTALIRGSTGLFLSIAIGSGWRAGPLDTTVQDRFYMVRSHDIHGAPSSYTKLSDADLYDATENLLGQGTTNAQGTGTQDVAEQTFATKEGWRIDLENPGEKVLAESSTLNNQIVFSTFEPSASATASCSPGPGTGRLYVVRATDATPVLNLSNVGQTADLVKDDRARVLSRSGIPPAPTALFPDGSPPVVLVGPEQPVPEFDFGQLTQRTYWLEDASN
jgi:type IV pilus assembly protein PilY1